MDKKSTVLLLGLVLAVVALGLGFFAASDGKKAAVVSCETDGKSHTIQITDSKPSDADVRATVCDTLTFLNDDKNVREIGFGVHDKHMEYDGISEKILSKGKKFTVSLNQTGTYHWHD